MSFTFGTFFSGIGGIDLGFEQAGLKCQFQVEIDRYCQIVLNNRFPDVPKWLDITSVSGKELPKVDVIAFGSPCQDLSIVNSQRVGLDGKHSSLFYEGIRLMAELAPAIGVWENVPNALSSNAGRDFARVLGAFRDIGARDICWRVLDARYFGVPQRRRRLFLVASFRDESASEILLERERQDYDPKTKNPPENEVYAFNKRGGNLGWGESKGIAPTLIGSRVDKVPIIFQEGNGRFLTPVEYERLQGFPDDWTEGCSVSQRYKQLGNAVAVPIARWIGERILNRCVIVKEKE